MSNTVLYILAIVALEFWRGEDAMRNAPWHVQIALAAAGTIAVLSDFWRAATSLRAAPEDKDDSQ